MANMQELLSLVNRLQQACTLTEFSENENKSTKSDSTSINLWKELPQIVVVGGQSSGKSSVLEAIVGRDFLPRGTGIVTRRPLLLQLVKTEQGPERGEFLHLYNQSFTSFDDMRIEIERETERTCANKSVSPTPIQLTIYSPNVPHLTLVDMPGLTKIAVGDQPQSIVEDIESMVKLYIDNENAIILAVSPANADLATSDSIKLSSEVDPEGLRTIGVLTKLDIMDDGTDSRDVLIGESMPLKNGWVGVVNRSQADINGKKNMKQTRQKERAFFSNHSAYADLTSNTGIDALSDKLQAMLQKKIVQQIPKIKDFLSKNLTQTEGKIRALGPSLIDTTFNTMSFENGNIESDNNKRAFLFKIILDIARRFEQSYSSFVDEHESGGCSILKVFEELLKQKINDLPLMEQHFTREKVKRAIEASSGWQRHLIAPEAGYRKLIQNGIDTMKAPALDCVAAVHSILENGVRFALNSIDELHSFQTLRDELLDIASKSLDALSVHSKAMVSSIIAAEACLIDADFFRDCPMTTQTLKQSLKKKSNVAATTISEKKKNEKKVNTLGAAEYEVIEEQGEEDNRRNVNQEEENDIVLDGEVKHAIEEGQQEGKEEEEEEEDELVLIGRHCHSYVRRAQHHCLQSLPKAIILHSVINSKQQLLTSFYDTIGSKVIDLEQLEDLLAEDPIIMEKRRALMKQMELLTAAREEISHAGFA